MTKNDFKDWGPYWNSGKLNFLIYFIEEYFYILITIFYLDLIVKRSKL